MNESITPGTQQERRRFVRWAVAVMAGGFAFVSYIERMNISIAAEQMIPDLSPSKIGWMHGWQTCECSSEIRLIECVRKSQGPPVQLSFARREDEAQTMTYLRMAAWFIILSLSLACSTAAQQPTGAIAREKVILDTDIGDDIDDAFALAFVLSSPEIDLLGVSTAWGNTQLRARVVDRLFCETGKEQIPILAGIDTTSQLPMDHARWAEAMPPRSKPFDSSIDFILEQIRRNPNQITLLAIAPMTNVGALIERDAATFRKLKRVVIMGGSIYRGYNDLGYTPDHGPDPEYNIKSDVAAARRLLASGVPLYVMPLDSTQLKLDEIKRELVFRQSTPLTDALTLLYHQWGQQTPTLYDPVAAVFSVVPEICPTQPMHVEVDEKGFTRPIPGTPNAQVCLKSKSEDFFQLYLKRILTQKLVGHCNR